jgi:luciferase-like monooxygenase
MATLAAALEEAAAELPGVTSLESAGASEYRLGDRTFAAIEADRAASFCLSPAVAAAAVHTPDTVPSPRGPDWVTLRPSAVDGHAVDRAVAWLESAWRHAGG